MALIQPLIYVILGLGYLVLRKTKDLQEKRVKGVFMFLVLFVLELIVGDLLLTGLWLAGMIIAYVLWEKDTTV